MKHTHFGFETVSVEDKARRVDEVFHSVAKNYDKMNDIMSFGLHRLWKNFALSCADIRSGDTVLDVASGSGDLAFAIAKKVGVHGKVIASDINASMLAEGRNKCLNQGCVIPWLLADAEHLPFANNSIDVVTLAFGLRNMTNKEAALREIYRVLKPTGRLMVLEFSQIDKHLAPLYDLYSLRFLPIIGKWVAGDEKSYRYLAESIRVHPPQEELLQIMQKAGFSNTRYYNVTAGLVAIHLGNK